MDYDGGKKEDSREDYDKDEYGIMVMLGIG